MEGLLPGERIDDLMRNGLKLIQQEDGFRFGIDSVLLADFAVYGRMERVADLGTGSGILPILMADACPGARFDAIELDAAAANRARRSVEMNGLAGRIRVHCMDMRVAAQNLGYGAFGACVCNPPYGKKGGALASARQDIRLARHEGEVSIEDVCACAAQLLKNGGRLSVVFPGAARERAAARNGRRAPGAQAYAPGAVLRRQTPQDRSGGRGEGRRLANALDANAGAVRGGWKSNLGIPKNL